VDKVFSVHRIPPTYPQRYPQEKVNNLMGLNAISQVIHTPYYYGCFKFFKKIKEVVVALALGA